MLACLRPGADAALARASLAVVRLHVRSRGRTEGAWSGDGDLTGEEAINRYFADKDARMRAGDSDRAAAAPSSLAQACGTFEPGSNHVG